MEQANIRINNVLTFTLKNNSKNDYYSYILHISENGKIKSIYQTIDECDEDALIKKGLSKDFRNFAVFKITEKGEDTIKLIITRKPIDINLLQQDEFKKNNREFDRLTPLEHLLTIAVHGKRGPNVKCNVRDDEWGTLQYSIKAVQ